MPPGQTAHAAATAGCLIQEGEIPREADCCWREMDSNHLFREWAVGIRKFSRSRLFRLLRLSRSRIHISARGPPWFSLSSPAPRATHRAGLEHGMSRLWRAALRSGFVVLTVKLKYTFALYRLDQQSLNAQTKASTRSGEYPAAARSIFAWWRHTASKWCRIRRSRRSATPPISILWQACCI